MRNDRRPRFGDDEGDPVDTVVRAPTVTLTREVVRLVVVEGPDTGRSFVLDPDSPGRVFVGTSPVCALRLVDPMVSRRHVALEVDPPRYRVTDLGSTNGTLLDGVLVREAWAHVGQTLRLGETAIRLETNREEQRQANPVTSAVSFGQVIGASPAMRRLYPLAERLARATVPVIIEGETGTGKEVLAESLHGASGRPGPFVVFDCTAVSPSVVEAELFGHDRGAFTGAVGSRPGIFEEANGGTLLIDEIGDLDLPLQAKLLRVIDRGELRRVGGSAVIKVDVRIIAATRRDLDRAVTEGQFRDDLFHRLAVARIELPPLRDRTGDVALLIRHFAERLGGSPAAVPPHTTARLIAQSWPGNVRELRNAVARYLALGEDGAEGLEPAPLGGTDLVTDEDVDVPFAVARRRAVARFERAYVDKLIDKHGGNVSQAARASGLAVRYFRLVKARAR
jgi:two-component system, NtrC family, response regulator HydG